MMVFFLITHLMLNGNNRSEIIFIIIVGLLGSFVDTIFLQSSLIIYEGLTLSFFAPLWIISMWLGFAATIANLRNLLSNPLPA